MSCVMIYERHRLLLYDIHELEHLFSYPYALVGEGGGGRGGLGRRRYCSWDFIRLRRQIDVIKSFGAVWGKVGLVNRAFFPGLLPLAREQYYGSAPFILWCVFVKTFLYWKYKDLSGWQRANITAQHHSYFGVCIREDLSLSEIQRSSRLLGPASGVVRL